MWNDFNKRQRMIIKNQNHYNTCGKCIDLFTAPYREGFKNFQKFHEAISSPPVHLKREPISKGKKIALFAKGLLYCLPIINRIIYLAVKLLCKHQIDTKPNPAKQRTKAPSNPTSGIKIEENKESLCPKDVKLHILSYLGSADLSNMARVNKNYQELADIAKIQRVNREKCSLTELGSNFENILELLKRHGDKLEYLGVSYDIEKSLEVLKYCPNLKHLTISFCNIQDSGLAQIISNDFPRLETLCLTRNHVTCEGIKALAASNHFPKLKTLYLVSNSVDVEGMTAFAASPHFSQLEELKFSHADNFENFDQQLEVFASSPNFPRLRSLNLEANRIGFRGMQALANSPHFINLETLNLNSCKLDFNSLESFAGSRNFPKLHSLDLHSINSFEAEENSRRLIRDPDFYKDIQKLAASPYFPNLQELDLSDNLLNDESLESLANSSHFPQLHTLKLGGNNFSSKSIKAFADSIYFPELKKLNLSSVDIDDEGCAALANSPHFSKLISLYLSSKKIQTKGAVDFAASPNFPKLQELCLYSIFSDEGVRALIHSQHFPLLKKLVLSPYQIKEKALRKLVLSEKCPKKLKMELDYIDNQHTNNSSTRSS